VISENVPCSVEEAQTSDRPGLFGCRGVYLSECAPAGEIAEDARTGEDPE
jgi:hypothetical protein